MNIVEATRDYETWLIANTFIVQKHLLRKHELMRKGAFAFLCATFYRWAQMFPEICDKLRSAPRVAAVADLHIENFGTWRDVDGRLVWGVYDFDEAFPLPYTHDLVRLASSAIVAISEDQLALAPKEACEAILEGYRSSIQCGGRPFVLEVEHKRLRAMTSSRLREPRRFWKKITSEERLRGGIPDSAAKILDEAMPEAGLNYQLVTAMAGLGSLGRFRVVAVTDWRGGKIAREVRALVPSGWVWARQGMVSGNFYQRQLDRALRLRDPSVLVKGNWLTRRLAPYCCRIEIDDLPKKRDDGRLLHAMGSEAANVHLGGRDSADRIARDLAKRKANWLRDAAKDMAEAITRDWKDWKNS